MRFCAKSKYVRFSPYKMRPIVDVIRGKDVISSLNWLTTYKLKRVVPVKKVLESAVANAKELGSIEKNDLFIKEVYVDHGPSYKYYKPSARGIASVLKKRSCHISIVLESKNSKED